MTDQLNDSTLVKPDDQKWIKSIGIYQVIGGGVGCLIFLGFSFFAYGFSLLLLPAFLFFGFSVYAGAQSITLKENALKLTLLNQALQLISFSLGFFDFKYVSGLSLELHISLSDGFSMGLHFNISSFSYHIGEGLGVSFGLNVIPLAILYKIRDIKSGIETALWRKETEMNRSQGQEPNSPTG